MAKNTQTAAQKTAAEAAPQADGTADAAEQLDPKTAIKVLKPFSASENGCTVDDYPAGLYASLPPVASKYAIAIEAVSEDDAKKLLAVLAAEEQQQEAAE